MSMQSLHKLLYIVHMSGLHIHQMLDKSNLYLNIYLNIYSFCNYI